MIQHHFVIKNLFIQSLKTLLYAQYRLKKNLNELETMLLVITANVTENLQ